MNAFEFARRKHEGQTRKFTGLPYMVHCCNVASLSSLYSSGNIQVIMVGYLHDTIEDTETTKEELSKIFGGSIADDVWFLTNVDKSAGNRKHRKKLDNERLAYASSVAQTVKLADIMDNVPSMLIHKPEFGKRYLREKLDTVKVLTKANPELLNLTRNYLNGLNVQYGDK